MGFWGFIQSFKQYSLKTQSSFRENRCLVVIFSFRWFILVLGFAGKMYYKFRSSFRKHQNRSLLLLLLLRRLSFNYLFFRKHLTSLCYPSLEFLLVPRILFDTVHLSAVIFFFLIKGTLLAHIFPILFVTFPTIR